mgnify:CR=1 FL=1
MKFKLDKLYKKIIVHIAIILSLILLVETFVCNYKHFLKMDGETVTYEMKDMRKYGFQYNISNDCYIVTEDSQVLEIVDINQEITTVYLDFTHLDETVYETKATIYYTDETRLTYASGSKPLKIIPEYENSKYLQEDFFGKTNKFRFQFSLKKGDKVKINCVTFNKKIPFNFSFIRVAAMGVITLGIYLFVMAFHYKDKLLEIYSEMGYKTHVDESGRITIELDEKSVFDYLVIAGGTGYRRWCGRLEGSPSCRQQIAYQRRDDIYPEARDRTSGAW